MEELIVLEHTADECCIIFVWQTDAYQETGCYNLHCSGFVQTNNRIAIGAAISPTSVYNGRQFDISLLIWKVYLLQGHSPEPYANTRTNACICMVI